MDARMPQLDWRDENVPMAGLAAKSKAQWAAIAGSTPVLPIGCNVDLTGKLHADPSELTAFADLYLPAGPCSIWSYQHLSDPEWSALEARSGAATGSCG